MNKNSGKVFVLGNGNNLQQVSLNDQAKDQLFIVSAAEEYYVFTNQQSSNVLSNLYNPNDGAPIVAEDLSNYDNPSQKWKLTKVDGNWYRIENKSTNSGNSCLQVENDARNDGANIVQATWANKDSQLWGAQFVQSADNTGIEDSKKTFMTLAPTMVEKSFVVIGDQFDGIELYSLAVFKMLNMRGTARIDFLYDNKNKKLYVDEVNSIPWCFAHHLWEARNISYKELLNIMLADAIAVEIKNQGMTTTLDSKVVEKLNNAQVREMK